ncbi:hypothetical protein ACROYT_G029748 [Oculina patagonica]
MESRQPKVNVSFSIENILRDDFPYRQKANETVSLPTSETNFERWPNTAVYQYYAAHFSPVVVRSLPNMHRVEGRFNGCNGGREQILCQEHNTTAGYSRCQDESALQHKKGPKINGKEEESFNSKACSSDDGTRKRKKRNRSHFTKHQLEYLEKLFSRQKYLTRDERTLLARSLEMTELQIRNWFQNRRYLKRHQANRKTQSRMNRILQRVYACKAKWQVRC